MSGVYLFAQALNNSGAVEFWRHSDDPTGWNKLSLDDSLTHELRQTMDALMERGRIYFQSTGVECRAFLAGPALIKLTPATLDVDGRLSPVLLQFNYLRRAQSWRSIESVMNLVSRELSGEVMSEFAQLQDRLGRPRLLIFFDLLFAHS